jgi:hypothetical protein
VARFKLALLDDALWDNTKKIDAEVFSVISNKILVVWIYLFVSSFDLFFLLHRELRTSC